MLTKTTFPSPLGSLRLFARADELVGLYLPTQTSLLDASEGRDGGVPVLQRATEQLAAYFAGELREFDLPLGADGTGFQHLVWRALGTIPFGETRTYGAIAHAIGRPAASRAVGAANGRNPISIIVPCHRVIGASGELTGYAGGVEMKQWLLAHERRSSLGMHAPRDPSSIARC